VRFASLGSGSKGNSSVVAHGSTAVLVDCGFSARETERRLDRLGLTAKDIDAIFVTHEHSDHCAGVARMARKHDLPVYSSHGTYHSGRCGEVDRINFCYSERAIRIGDLEITPVAVPHDAREPCQFVIRGENRVLGILTDLGSVTPFVCQQYRRCDALILEFNHDLEMLNRGSYPPSVKHRVGGDWGHLNNHQSAALLGSLEMEQIQHLVVAHISEQNNSPELAESALEGVFPFMDRVVWADQTDGVDWMEIE
jgi:phosphoribosyl 1,2-cyclic phosphodiesterase